MSDIKLKKYADLLVSYSLKEKKIFGRRYFYPLISQFPIYRGLESAKPGKLINAERITQQVICLPIYPALEEDTILKISKLIKNFKN